MAWFMPDEPGAAVEAIEPGTELVVPALFWAEIRNVMLVGERRGRIRPGIAETLLAQIDGLDLIYDTAPVDADVLRLARTHGLTIYDALYLELALRGRAALLTLDRALARAARAEGVAV